MSQKKSVNPSAHLFLNSDECIALIGNTVCVSAMKPKKKVASLNKRPAAAWMLSSLIPCQIAYWSQEKCEGSQKEENFFFLTSLFLVKYYDFHHSNQSKKRESLSGGTAYSAEGRQIDLACFN